MWISLSWVDDGMENCGIADRVDIIFIRNYIPIFVRDSTSNAIVLRNALTWISLFSSSYTVNLISISNF